jgi:superfamily II DNA or RNA helicase
MATINTSEVNNFFKLMNTTSQQISAMNAEFDAVDEDAYELIEDELIEDELIEDELIEDTLIEDALIEDTLIEDELIEDELIEDELIEDTLIEDALIEDTLIEDELIEDELIEDELIEDELIEDDVNAFIALDNELNHTQISIVDTDEVKIEDDIIEYFGDKAIRWYQIAARNQTIDALVSGDKRICIVLPTGGGKTLAIACTLNSPRLKEHLGVKNRNLRVLFVSHVHRLLTQAELLFAEAEGVDIILQSTMSSIKKEVLDKGVDLIVQDECHHESTYSFQLNILENMVDVPIIGLTATPDRADGSLIKFDRLINPISREQAVAEGWLAESHIISFVDGSERKKTEIVKDILKQYATEMRGTLIFMRTLKEVTDITAYLTDMGYKAEGLTKQSNDTVNQILNDFSNGDVQFIVSCNKLGEGIDVKGCHSIVLGRTVGSYPLLNQIIGRSSRPDCDSYIYEIVNPLSDNLDTTVCVGLPKEHKLVYMHKGVWLEGSFDY